jgi:uncharacterized protein (TIGR00375 family)
MKIIADLHIHSKYARACSADLNPPNLAIWARKKGISVLGTGDFTHPGWLSELTEALVETKPGLYELKDQSAQLHRSPFDSLPTPYFMLTTEVALIYKQGEKVRRVHVLLFAPSFAVVTKLNSALEARGVNIKSDGRPIMGLHCAELVKICKGIDPRIEIIPAHAWTPHFGVFGSLSGFDTLEEAFGDQAQYIFAIETGLSSDPKMNWQVESIDNLSLISNSDAHSLRKLGREANVFEIAEQELSYDKIIQAIKNKNPQEFLYTIEFFPEEGKYHFDGHRDHLFSCLPEETKRLGGLCPKCGKKLLQGVLHRVDDLANRPFGFTDAKRVPYKSMIPLEEIIAETFGVGTASKKVLEQYENMVALEPEFSILLDLPEDEIAALSSAQIAQSIVRVRAGQVHIAAGYDGLFGKIQIYSAQERERLSLKPKQNTLF